MTTRRWMLVVAAFGLLLGGTILVGRSLSLRQAYLQRAALHVVWKSKLFYDRNAPGFWEDRWRDERLGRKGSYPWPDEPPFVPAISDYHDRMIAKWQYAADHPWMEVEPDPIERGP